jgi:hypothetical protein
MQSTDQINIDDFVDYSAEYRAVIKNAKITGDRILGKCPFHDDNKDSFTADIRTGKCHCFCGCIDGNFVTFWAKLNNIDTKEAYKQILLKYGKTQEPKPKEERNSLESLTLQEYALQKRLPEDFLKNVCRVETGKDRNGTQFLKVPYYDETGLKAPVFRKRYAHKEFRWSFGSSGKLTLYGLWRLKAVRDGGSVCLVEGESDTQTMWYLSFPTFGVPGASNFKAPMISALDGLEVYIHKEPDKGGDTFVEKVCRILSESDFSGNVYTWSCNEFGVKDPSELFIKYGKDDAEAKIKSAIVNARKIDLGKITDIIPEAVKGAPVNLRQPEGWMYSEAGISHIDEKKVIPTMICKTPIILIQRLKSIETGEEKIEIAFKRDGLWQTAIFPRSTVFTSRNITVLADLGCTVTSENAKGVVRFLEALEAENIDVISKSESTSTFGWQSNGRFLPGHADGLVLDIDVSLRAWAAAYHTSGDRSTWIKTMAPHRQRDKFRFILAASFTAPLLRILSQRIFFVYNWSDSRGGKTAALKAALSVWGDPEKLMVNFNATQVALERMAGFYNDLPMGIDERQLAGNKQENIEKIVYMLASGTGRARGSKAGGLQQLNTWRTVCLATGEEPLSTDTSQTGVSTRVLEVYGGPFEDEREASAMHQFTATTYGHAGKDFMDHLINTDEREINDLYVKMTEDVFVASEGAVGSHVAGIAAVATADVMIQSWIFSEAEDEPPVNDNGKQKLVYSEQAYKRSLDMARTILSEQLTEESQDVNENATQFLVDWILSNKAMFDDHVVGTRYGVITLEGKAYIFPTLFNQTLSKAGYSPRKTLKFLAEKKIVSCSEDEKGKKRYGVNKRVDGKVCRMIEFNLNPFVKDEQQIPNGVDDENPFEQEALPFS